MTNITYEILEQPCFLEGIAYISYGIAACARTKRNEAPAVIALVKDITPNRKKLLELVKNCNRLNLSPLHLKDVVEDFLIG